MEVTLENNYYAFSAREEAVATVTVTSGALDYSGQTNGPFRAAGSIAQGASREFTQPTIVAASALTVFEIEYPVPGPTEEDLAAAAPPLPPDIPDEDPQ